MTTVLQENLTGIRVVRAFGRQEFEVEKFRERNDAYRGLRMKLLEVAADRHGLRQAGAIIELEHGDRAARIDPPEVVAQLFALAEIDFDRLDLETLLGNEDSGSLRTRGALAIVELHWISSCGLVRSTLTLFTILRQG